MPHTIRRSTIVDVDRLIPLFDACRLLYGQSSDVAIAWQFLKDRFERDESVVLVAEDRDGTVVGFVQLMSGKVSETVCSGFRRG